MIVPWLNGMCGRNGNKSMMNAIVGFIWHGLRGTVINKSNEMRASFFWWFQSSFSAFFRRRISNRVDLERDEWPWHGVANIIVQRDWKLVICCMANASPRARPLAQKRTKSFMQNQILAERSINKNLYVNFRLFSFLHPLACGVCLCVYSGHQANTHARISHISFLHAAHKREHYAHTLSRWLINDGEYIISFILRQIRHKMSFILEKSTHTHTPERTHKHTHSMTYQKYLFVGRAAYRVRFRSDSFLRTLGLRQFQNKWHHCCLMAPDDRRRKWEKIAERMWDAENCSTLDQFYMQNSHSFSSRRAAYPRHQTLCTKQLSRWWQTKLIDENEMWPSVGKS